MSICLIIRKRNETNANSSPALHQVMKPTYIHHHQTSFNQPPDHLVMVLTPGSHPTALVGGGQAAGAARHRRRRLRPRGAPQRQRGLQRHGARRRRRRTQAAGPRKDAPLGEGQGTAGPRSTGWSAWLIRICTVVKTMDGDGEVDGWIWWLTWINR